MKWSTPAALATMMLAGLAPASYGQTGSTPMTVGWSTITGCYTGTTLLISTTGYVYTATSPTTTGSTYGMCGSSNLGPWNTPSVGWVGYTNTGPTIYPTDWYEPPPSTPTDLTTSLIETDDDAPPSDGPDGSEVPQYAPTLPQTTVTPEPASLLLVGTGLAGIGAIGWRRRRRAASR